VPAGDLRVTAGFVALAGFAGFTAPGGFAPLADFAAPAGFVALAGFAVLAALVAPVGFAPPAAFVAPTGFAAPAAVPAPAGFAPRLSLRRCGRDRGRAVRTSLGVSDRSGVMAGWEPLSRARVRDVGSRSAIRRRVEKFFVSALKRVRAFCV
jgi:hypothetical protein